ncbi:MAG TPA: NAD(P)H-quinone oxidoreductase [Puia sp.]|jgi:NADPH2:quinone reductase|nr:NAD(P)H-quinone oxidoreductase [Puia sp.]
MKAIVITQPGDAGVLRLQHRGDPQPQGDEVLIEVKASGLNRADIFQRQGNYPAPPGVPADIPGLEIAGIVKTCGPDVTGWKPGDRVCALIAGGGYAQYAVAREGQCLPIPAIFDFVEAAALPEALSTVWSNVFQRGRLKAGENFLVHGGNSGIGTAAIQLAKAFGASVYATVGSDEKGKICLDLGADRFINYKTRDFAAELAATGIDVILDMVGGDYLQKNISVLREEGRLVYINSVAGNTPGINLHQLMVKRLTVTGSTLRTRDYSWRKALSAELQDKVWPLLATGRYKPYIYQTLPYTEAVEAHRLMETGQHTGKIMLSWE